MSKGVRYNSGRQRYVGPLLKLNEPISLDPVQYEGAIVYADDGNIYYSNGIEWVIPVDRIPIARPIALTPTTATEQAQLRLNTYFSVEDIPQTGAYFEVSLTESFETPLFTRTVSGDGVNMYQTLYPDDGLTPGQTFYWRARYLGGTEQSQFSRVISQIYPDIITTPVQITPADTVQGSVTISDYESPFGLIFVETQIEIYNETGVTLVTSFTDTTASKNQFTLPNTLVEGTTYTWRARRGGKVGLAGATQYSAWTGKRKVVNGAKSIVLTYDTAIMSAKTIGIPMAGTVNCTVNWGDGLTDTYTTAGIKTHTYGAGVTGTVTVTISGTLTTWGGQSGITAAQQQGLTRVESIGFQLGLTSLSYAFANTSVNLVYISPQIPPEVTNMSYAFTGSATQADLRTLNVSNITNMSYCFYASTGIGPQIEGWNVSKVTTAEGMFAHSAFNRPFNNCNWASCTTMFGMFGSTAAPNTSITVAFNQPINGWNVSNVQNMSYMFGFRRTASVSGGTYTSNFNQPLSNWNTGNVTNMEGMFGASPQGSSFQYTTVFAFNQPLNTWNTSKVTNMSYMFGTKYTLGGATHVFNQDLTNWDVTKVTTMTHMFANNAAFQGNISTWSCASCTNMSEMFTNSNRGTGPNPILQSGSTVWQTPEVTTCQRMFFNNASFNRNIFLWKLPKCTDISYMFSGTVESGGLAGANPVLQSGTDVWETPVATNASFMCAYNATFNSPLSLWNTSSITNMQSMFQMATAFNQPIGTWNTGNVTNMSKMFASHDSTSTVYTLNFNQNIGAWNVSKVTDMSYMFGSSSVNAISQYGIISFNNGGSSDINNWNTSNVVNMEGMFGNGITTTPNTGFYFNHSFNQPIGNWNVSKVTNMSKMFNFASSSSSRNRPFDQDISSWQLNPSVNLSNFMSTYGALVTSSFSSTNYSRLLAKWATYIATINGPYAAAPIFTGTKYSNTTIFPADRFTNGAAGRTFLTTARGVVVAGCATANGDGVYTFNSGTGVYTNANNWYFTKTGGSWKLYDNSNALKATGTGDVAVPWLSTAWDGDLVAPATVLNNGVGWTITDGGAL